MILSDKKTIIKDDAVNHNLNRIINQIFKLLPLREEKQDWMLSLNNISVEVKGLASIINNHYDLFPLVCKLEGLKQLGDEVNFIQFRKTIFECIGHCTEVKKLL